MAVDAARRGALAGVAVIELASVGPVQFCGQMLADHGADVIRVDRLNGWAGKYRVDPSEVMGRGRRSVAIDLKHPDGPGTVLTICRRADILIEGMRPGVAERLGVGPAECLASNARLVYGRATGWGQTGPLAALPGHDINYLAIAGVLGTIGRADAPPVPPINLVGDMGGGGLMLAFGLLAALVEARSSGQGQVVDAAMCDGAANLASLVFELFGRGDWQDHRGVNTLDSGAPYYDVYPTADGRHVAVGSVEAKAYDELLNTLDLFAADRPAQDDRSRWPELRAALTRTFATRSRDEWAAVFADGQACVVPVLSLGEAPEHPHNVEREMFCRVDGIVAPAPAPRLSRTPGTVVRGAPAVGADTDEVLREWGVPAAQVAQLRADGAIR